MIYLTTDFGDIPWPFFVNILWGLGLAIQALTVYQSSGRAGEEREQRIRREIALKKERLGLADSAHDKPKRKSIRLFDDGELVADDEQDIRRRTFTKN